MSSYFLGSNAFYIIYDPIAQLTVSLPIFCIFRVLMLAQSIIPTMILLLVGLKMTTNDIQSRSNKATTVTLTRPSFRPGTVTGTQTTSVLSTPFDRDVDFLAPKVDSEYGLSDLPHRISNQGVQEIVNIGPSEA
jgi:hypothetical protein